MPTSNAEVAELLRRYAAALTLEGADRFKVKAYRRAADSIESHDRPVTEMISKGEDLTKLPGVGKAISEKISDIVKTGKLRQLEKSIANASRTGEQTRARPQGRDAGVQEAEDQHPR
jgi:DNA polymerase (family X)